MSQSNLIDYVQLYHKALDRDCAVVIDVETTLIKLGESETLFTHTPKFVMGGVESVYVELKTVTDLGTFNEYLRIFTSIEPHDVLVGHNISYDMLFFREQWINNPNLMIWDTMIAEYLLSDQRIKMGSLDTCLELIGSSARKKTEVSAAMEDGCCPSNIPKEMLEEYLKQDLKITRELFKHQHARFKEKPRAWQNMFIMQMLFRINTFRASYNGMKINTVSALNSTAALELEVSMRTDQLARTMAYLAGDITPMVAWNPASNQHVASVLYGGEVLIDALEATGETYKTGPRAGTAKMRKTKVPFSTLNHCGEAGAINARKVDESALKVCLDRPCVKSTVVQVFIEDLLEWRDMNKTLNTYYKGYMSSAAHDSYIHPTFNHALTSTGRLTCSKPNLQNIKG